MLASVYEKDKRKVLEAVKHTSKKAGELQNEEIELKLRNTIDFVEYVFSKKEYIRQLKEASYNNCEEV